MMKYNIVLVPIDVGRGICFGSRYFQTNFIFATANGEPKVMAQAWGWCAIL